MWNEVKENGERKKRDWLAHIARTQRAKHKTHCTSCKSSSRFPWETRKLVKQMFEWNKNVSILSLCCCYYVWYKWTYSPSVNNRAMDFFNIFFKNLIKQLNVFQKIHFQVACRKQRIQNDNRNSTWSTQPKKVRNWICKKMFVKKILRVQKGSAQKIIKIGIPILS